MVIQLVSQATNRLMYGTLQRYEDIPYRLGSHTLTYTYPQFHMDIIYTYYICMYMYIHILGVVAA